MLCRAGIESAGYKLSNLSPNPTGVSSSINPASYQSIQIDQNHKGRIVFTTHRVWTVFEAIEYCPYKLNTLLTNLSNRIIAKKLWMVIIFYYTVLDRKRILLNYFICSFIGILTFHIGPFLRVANRMNCSVAHSFMKGIYSPVSVFLFRSRKRKMEAGSI